MAFTHVDKFENLVSRKGHLMEVKNPWKARCVVKSIFQTDLSVLYINKNNNPRENVGGVGELSKNTGVNLYKLKTL